MVFQNYVNASFTVMQVAYNMCTEAVPQHPLCNEDLLYFYSDDTYFKVWGLKTKTLYSCFCRCCWFSFAVWRC